MFVTEVSELARAPGLTQATPSFNEKKMKPGKSSNLPKVTQQVSGRDKTRTQVFFLIPWDSI